MRYSDTPQYSSHTDISTTAYIAYDSKSQFLIMELDTAVKSLLIKCAYDYVFFSDTYQLCINCVGVSCR